jgi:hypothetical protein
VKPRSTARRGSQAPSLAAGLLLALSSAACSTAEVARDTPAGKTPGPAIELELRRDPSGSRHLGSWPGATLRLVNRGSTPITVVEPGNGSPEGLRTPVLSWLVVNGRGEQVEQRPLVYCGTINPFEPEDLVRLDPGASVTFEEYLGFPTLTGPPPFEVWVRYTNDPRMDWADEPLGPDVPGRDDLWASTPCTALSNKLVVDSPSAASTKPVIGLELRRDADGSRHLGSWPGAALRLTNRCATTITVIRPGDGSPHGMRGPRVARVRRARRADRAEAASAVRHHRRLSPQNGPDSIPHPQRPAACAQASSARR